MHRESLAERIRQQAEKDAADLSNEQVEQCARILSPVLTRQGEVVSPQSLEVS